MMRAPILPDPRGPRAHTLPVTRFARGRRGWRGWSFAVALALAVNLGVVSLLAVIGRHVDAVIDPPPAARRIVQADPPPPPPPLPAADEPEDKPAEEVPQMTLPALDLASPDAPAVQFSLPPTTGAFDPDNLTVAVPAFSVPAPRMDAPAAHAAETFEEVDQPATIDSPFDLERFYPIGAREHGIEGRTDITIIVDDDGRVADVEVGASTPPGVFESASARLARSLHFHPALRHGIPKRFRYTTTIAWTMKP